MLEQERAEYLQVLGAAIEADKVGSIPTWAETQKAFAQSLAQSPDPHLSLLRELGVA